MQNFTENMTENVNFITKSASRWLSCVDQILMEIWVKMLTWIVPFHREYLANNVSVTVYPVNEPWLYSILWCSGVPSVSSDAPQVLRKVPYPIWLMVNSSPLSVSHLTVHTHTHWHRQGHTARQEDSRREDRDWQGPSKTQGQGRREIWGGSTDDFCPACRLGNNRTMGKILGQTETRAWIWTEKAAGFWSGHCLASAGVHWKPLLSVCSCLAEPECL